MNQDSEDTKALKWEVTGNIVWAVLWTVVVLMASLVPWYIGAYFSLAALENIGIPIAALGAAKWGVPVYISVIEVLGWRRSVGRWTIPFLAVLAFDVVSTAFGVWPWLDEMLQASPAQFQVSLSPAARILICVLLANALTLIPERLILWIVPSLVKLYDAWRFVWNLKLDS
jgi:hypothetical protein